jgi:hypothetical protein
MMYSGMRNAECGMAPSAPLLPCSFTSALGARLSHGV